uniref:Uncharacterized protein n=1 Tax=Rhizophora mucronata TaxID=61149 RepID=A0A2P2JDB8_RHIMU
MNLCDFNFRFCSNSGLPITPCSGILFLGYVSCQTDLYILFLRDCDVLFK